jgi:hypothetical protein
MAIGDYWWLNYHRLLVVIGGYFFSGYCWLFYYRPLVVILLMTIDSCSIRGYQWLLY